MHRTHLQIRHIQAWPCNHPSLHGETIAPKHCHCFPRCPCAILPPPPCLHEPPGVPESELSTSGGSTLLQLNYVRPGSARSCRHLPILFLFPLNCTDSQSPTRRGAVFRVRPWTERTDKAWITPVRATLPAPISRGKTQPLPPERLVHYDESPDLSLPLGEEG